MIDSFYVDGVHTVPSNFYHWRMAVNGREFETMEHYFQSMKTLNWEDSEAIRRAETPGEAKRIGRTVKLRADWERVKIPVMRWGLMHKFELNNEMGEWLLGTNDELLVEGNTWGDRFWGQVNRVGENWLGVLLMVRRAELRGT